jgi:subtilisin family serine protease
MKSDCANESFPGAPETRLKEFVSRHRLTGASVSVGLVDSGCRSDALLEGAENGVALVAQTGDLALAPNTDCNDRNGHGSICAKLIKMTAPGVTIVPIRVFSRRLEATPSVIAAGIRWSIDRGISVLNLSLGTQDPSAKSVLESACEAAASAGIILVAATALGRTSYPAAFECVLSVGCAGWGRPGEYGAVTGGEVDFVTSGDPLVRRGAIARPRSSFAAPRIAALCGLLRERWPDLSLADARTHLRDLADRRWSFSDGRYVRDR